MNIFRRFFSKDKRSRDTAASKPNNDENFIHCYKGIDGEMKYMDFMGGQIRSRRKNGEDSTNTQEKNQ